MEKSLEVVVVVISDRYPMVAFRNLNFKIIGTVP